MAEVTTNSRRILIAMDGSKHASNAFVWFMEHFYKDGDTLIIVYCAELGANLPPIAQLANPGVVPIMIAEHDEEVQKVLKIIDDIVKQYNVKYSVERLHEPAGESIVLAAKDHNIDIIVTGSRGMGVVRRTILGSVSDYIVHHSHVPVLVCKYSDQQLNTQTDAVF